MGFDITGLGSLFDFGSKVLARVIPDPAQRATAQLELAKLHQAGELAALAAEADIVKGQLAINAKEAENPNLFVSGWRPGAGWVCVLALAYEFLIRPMLIAFGKMAPTLDMGDLLTMLGGLLGLGTLRTAEKMKGVASK